MTRRRVLWAVATVAALTAVAAAAVALRSIPGQTRPHQRVGVDGTALRDAFNADHGSVRVLALVSPTCGACLRGASDLQRDVFAAISDPRLRGYIVWVPKLDGQESNVDEATHTIGDPRANHYWDGDSVLVRTYDSILRLGQDAWDVYLLYGPNVRWDSRNPPLPAYWMHQLRGVTGPTLDTNRLAEQVRTLLTDA
jgi:hypothetical protein